MAVTLMTVAEYARHRGCDEKAVRKALAEGRVTRHAEGRRCIDPEVADIQWAKNTRARGDSTRRAADQQQGGATPPAGGKTGGSDDYSDHRARRERAEADRAELLALREQEKVLLREPSERAVFDAFRALRDDAFQAMRDAAPKVREVTEVREIARVLEEQLRTAFENFDRKTRQRLAELAQQSRPQ